MWFKICIIWHTWRMYSTFELLECALERHSLLLIIWLFMCFMIILYRVRARKGVCHTDILEYRKESWAWIRRLILLSIIIYIMGVLAASDPQIPAAVLHNNHTPVSGDFPNMVPILNFQHDICLVPVETEEVAFVLCDLAHSYWNWGANAPNSWPYVVVKFGYILRTQCRDFTQSELDQVFAAFYWIAQSSGEF